MIALQSNPAELRFTLEVTRKATGKVETFEMVGHAAPANDQQDVEELPRVGDAQHASP